MHRKALEHGKLFFDTYLDGCLNPTIIDIGAQDVNGSLRSVAPADARYIGVDFVAGKGVDLVITDPYHLPLEDASADVCVSSSCFEHSEFFWLSFLDIMRVLKPSGLFYLNVPSNGFYHRYPVDCWRFYPDSGMALRNWARRSGIRAELLESFTGRQGSGVWNDFVAVFVKDEANAGRFTGRMQDRGLQFTNGYKIGRDELANPAIAPEDQSSFTSRLRRKWHRLSGRPE